MKKCLHFIRIFIKTTNGRDDEVSITKMTLFSSLFTFSVFVVTLQTLPVFMTGKYMSVMVPISCFISIDGNIEIKVIKVICLCPHG